MLNGLLRLRPPVSVAKAVCAIESCRSITCHTYNPNIVSLFSPALPAYLSRLSPSMRAAVGRDALAAGAAVASPCSTSGRAALLRPLVVAAAPGFRGQASGAAAAAAVPSPSPSPLLAGASSSSPSCSPSCYSQQRQASLLSRRWSSISSTSHRPVATAASGRGDGATVADGAAGSSPASSSSPPRPSAADLSAASAQLLSDDQLRAAGLRLPSHCCGCGMRLQRRDAEAPG
mgnify:CR=1 FL=1